MKVKINLARYEEVDIEANFPIYHKYDLECDSILYTRIDEDLTCYQIHVRKRGEKADYELETRKWSFEQRSPAEATDYLLGKGRYASTKQEFDKVVRGLVLAVSKINGSTEERSDPGKVICPNCVHQFRAIPLDVQAVAHAAINLGQSGVLAALHKSIEELKG